MGASRRWETRVITVFAVASVAVVWAATAAEAKQINSVSQLKSSCAKGNGVFIGTSDGSFGVCQVKGGEVICDDKKTGKKCQGYRNLKRGVVPAETVRGAHGVTISTRDVPGSQTWKQKLSVANLGDVLCTSFHGQFAASADATLGTCTLPTAIIFCNDRQPGDNCVGVANTKKDAASISRAFMPGLPPPTTVQPCFGCRTVEATPDSRRGGETTPEATTTTPSTRVPRTSVPVEPPK